MKKVVLRINKGSNHLQYYRNWDVEVSHTFREGNGCTDGLAKLGAKGSTGLRILPREACSLVAADPRGESALRM